MGFDGWQYVETLGRGAFGTVYKAKREEHGYTQYAAIKEISLNSQSDFIFDNHQFSDINAYNEYLVGKIIDEVRTMEKVKGHTNIVGYEDYKAVQDSNGNYKVLIRMELLTPLKEYIKNRVLTRGEIIKIGADICNALDICEKNGIIHRDVKIDNVFVNSSGDFKLGDFGTAKVLDSVQTTYTSVGTLTYMAPEVLLGGHYDCRVDQYSLAVMLYYLFNNNCPPAKNGGEITVPPVNADKAVADVILKGCSREKENRYNSIRDFRRALLAAGAGKQSSKKKKTNKGLLAAVLSVAAVLCVATVIAFILKDQKNGGETTVPDSSATSQGVSQSGESDVDYRILVNNLKNLKIGITDEKLKEGFGNPAYTRAQGGYTVSVFKTDVFTLRTAVNSKKELAGYVVTDVYNNAESTLTADSGNQIFKIGSKTYYDLEGKPSAVRIFKDSENNVFNYAEEYKSADGKTLYLFATFADGKDIGTPDYIVFDGEVDDEVSFYGKTETLTNR
ncbi:MAG: serine/threonine protein kinase, partial [Clostridia bacterium]|nr:serine/threonine protein kinase [Clostridia bacterium]